MSGQDFDDQYSHGDLDDMGSLELLALTAGGTS